MSSVRSRNPEVLITLVVASLAIGVLPAGAQSIGSQSAQFSQPVKQETSESLLNPVLFMPAVLYPSGDLEASSVAAVDVNGDGRPDLIVLNGCGSGIACSMQGSVAVLMGNGDGAFQAAVTYPTKGWGANSLVVADVTGDGKPDILVANLCAASAICTNPSTVAVLRGNGDGTFQPAITFSSGGWTANSLAVADVNGDGKPDILVANGCSTGATSCPNNGQVAVLLRNADGTFQPAVTYSSGGTGPTSVAVADINEDSKPDLLVANSGVYNGAFWDVGSVSVLLGDGDGTFRAAVRYSSGGSFPWSVATADVNGDGKADLVVTNSCWCAGHGTVAILLGKGDHTFQPALSYDSGGNLPFSAAIADINGDGNLDLVVADRCRDQACNTDASLGVLLGRGDGTFQPVVVFDSGGDYTNSVVAHDVNGDGRPDLVAANFGGAGVLLNKTPLCPTAPVVTLFATPTILWPPDGKMVPVTFSGTITSAEGACSIRAAAYAVSDEYGRIHPNGTVTLGSGGAYTFTVWLEASRLGMDADGRIYTLTVSATNNIGMTVTRSAEVLVPHDRR